MIQDWITYTYTNRGGELAVNSHYVFEWKLILINSISTYLHTQTLVGTTYIKKPNLFFSLSNFLQMLSRLLGQIRLKILHFTSSLSTAILDDKCQLLFIYASVADMSHGHDMTHHQSFTMSSYRVSEFLPCHHAILTNFYHVVMPLSIEIATLAW